MHNDEIKQALVTLVMAAYEHDILTRQEIKEFDPEYEAALRQNDQRGSVPGWSSPHVWSDASWGDWDRTPAPAYPVTGPEQDDPSGVRYNGQTYPLDEAVAYAESRGYVKPDYMTWEDAARYLRDLGHDVWLDYGTTTMTMVEPETEDDEDFGYLDEDEPVIFPQDESTIVAIGYAGAFYHPGCAVEEAISYGEASPAARDMALADLCLQIQDRLVSDIMVVTEITEVEDTECSACGLEFTKVSNPEGTVTTTGETISPEEPKKKGIFERIFGA